MVLHIALCKTRGFSAESTRFNTDWIQMDVPADRRAIRIALYHQCFVSALEQMSVGAVGTVVPRCVAREQPLHECAEIGLPCSHEQMNMVLHQGIGVQFNLKLFAE